MSISDPQFAAWLDDSSAQRATIFDIGVNSGGADITRLLSTKALIGGSASAPYLPYVSGGLKMTESISLTADASLAAGDIEFYNVSGERDAWLDDIYVNQIITAKVGDVRWPTSDFRAIFNGISADIDGTKNRGRLNLKLRDKMQRLNTSVTEEQMGGTAPNPDTLRPYVLGEAHNITPKLKNPATNEYEVCAVGIEDIIEVRVDGKKRTDITKNLSVGSFTFTGAVGGGAVTCSVQGVKLAGTYVNTCANLIKYLVTQCGKASTRFVDADLDLTSLAAFNTAHPQPMGLYIPDRMNVIEACHQLASSIGAQLVISRAGLLRLVQINFPTSATTDIRSNVQMERSITLVGQTDVAAAVTLGFCKNWTVQANLPTSLPPAHKELFAREWMEVSSVDATVKAAYKLDAAPIMQPTCLLDDTDAQVEADRRRDIFKVKRRTYRFEGTPANMLLDLGQAVKLYSNRYGMSAGKFGIVTSLAPNWDNFHVTVEVTV